MFKNSIYSRKKQVIVFISHTVEAKMRAAAIVLLNLNSRTKYSGNFDSKSMNRTTGETSENGP